MSVAIYGQNQSRLVSLASNNVTLTGVSTAPTAAAGTNTTQVANTAFVTTADNLKANLASPTLTGIPLAPTAASGTSTTQIATTSFVQIEMSANTVGRVTALDVVVADGATTAIITLASNASYLGHISYLSDKTRFKSIIFGVGQEGGTTQGAFSVINDPAGALFSISMSGGNVSVVNASGASQTFRIVLSKIGF